MTMITGQKQIEQLRWLTVRSALKIEIMTGMLRSNRGRSTRALANEITGKQARTKREAYDELNKFIVRNLGEEYDRPL